MGPAVPEAGDTGVRSESGLFLVFEGGDGVGKTTQIERLCRWLEAEDYDYVRTFEPGDTAAGSRIREIVLSPATGDLAPRAEALLYAADKAHHLHELVDPALARGAIVVCDRYVDSMLAYQGAGRVLEVAEVEQLARWATNDLRPQLTVLLDMDPDGAVGSKTDKDRVEAAGDVFHRRARQYFLELANREPEHYLVLNARDSRDKLEIAVRDRVQALIATLAGQLSAVPGRLGR
jgi:dTMP kinase